MRAKSVPTRSVAWSSWDCSHVVRRASPKTAAVTAATVRTIAALARGRRAACWTASGRTKERDRTPMPAAATSSRGTRRTATTVAAATQRTGAAVSATSLRVVTVSGCERSCHQANTATAIRSASSPNLASSQRRAVGSGVVPPVWAVATRTTASSTAAASTDNTNAQVRVGDWARPADSSAGRWVRREWTNAAMGRASSPATVASSSASTNAAPSCCRRLRPNPISSVRSPSRTEATNCPARKAAAMANAVLRSTTTNTVACVLTCCAWIWSRVWGRFEPTRAMRARSSTRDAARLWRGRVRRSLRSRRTRRPARGWGGR